MKGVKDTISVKEEKGEREEEEERGDSRMVSVRERERVGQIGRENVNHI